MANSAQGAQGVWSQVPSRGPWSPSEIRAFLERSAIPLRLGFVGGGAPWVASLWFLPADDGLWLATQPDSFAARSLTAEPTCGFEVAGDAAPYHGVRGTGRARIDAVRGPQVLEQLMARYGVRPGSRLARFLRERAAREVAIQIAPGRVSSWDFRERMTGAIGPR